MNWTAYLGTWYELKRTGDPPFQRGLSNVKAEYSLELDSDGSGSGSGGSSDSRKIKVTNSGTTESGQVKVATGTATIVGPGQLRVSFLPPWLDFLIPQKANYIILQTDYVNYSIVTDADNKYFWYLQREPL